MKLGLSFVGSQNARLELERLIEEGRLASFQFRAVVTTLCGDEITGTIESSGIRPSSVDIRTVRGLRVIGCNNVSALWHDYRGNRSFPYQNREVEEFVLA